MEQEREHGNGNAYDRGDYNSSFALLAVELKKVILGGGYAKISIIFWGMPDMLGIFWG